MFGIFGSESGKAAREIYDCINSGEIDRCLDLVAPECEVTDVALGQTWRGPEGFRQYVQNWLKAFPDAKLDVQNVIESGDWVIAEVVGRGTHGGPFLTPTGQVTATGRQMELSFCDVMGFRDGKLYRGHTYYDGLTVLRQLGILPTQMAA